MRLLPALFILLIIDFTYGQFEEAVDDSATLNEKPSRCRSLGRSLF